MAAMFNLTQHFVTIFRMAVIPCTFHCSAYVHRLDPSSDDALLSSEALIDVESLQHFYSTD
eukprot:13264-Heterococcus_DN1.PRE.4